MNRIWSYLYGKLNNAYGVAGLMGNLYAESGLSPTNLQNSANKRLNITDEEYTRLVDEGAYPDFVSDKAGYGLVQWTAYSRKKALLEFAKKRGDSIGDLDMQLDFLWKELTENYSAVVDILKSAISIREASDTVLMMYEKPKDQSRAVQEKRAAYGEKIYAEEIASCGEVEYAESSEERTESMVIIGNAKIDEQGRISGGVAGDQTGKEVCSHGWVDKGWNKMIRPKNSMVAEKIARAMEQACQNNHIGYDQKERTSLYFLAREVGWDLSKITKNCETDCSALVAVCVNAAGIPVSKDMYTGNEAKVLKDTGHFTVYTDIKYLGSDMYLKRGDILLKEGSHTAVVLTNGSKAVLGDRTGPLNKSVKWEGKVTASELCVRKWAGTEYPECSFSPLMKGERISVCDSIHASDGKQWYYVQKNGKYGFCSAKYIAKV